MAAALGVALGSVAPLSNAGASIVYSGPVDVRVFPLTAGIYIDVVTGAIGATESGSPGWDINPWGVVSLQVWGNAPGGIVSNLGSSSTQVDNLALGTIVGPGNVFAPSPSSAETTGPTAFVLNSMANYIGFSFFNEATGTVGYGWMQFSLGAEFAGADRTILGWAYEDSGASIAVGNRGTLPEPGMLGLVAAGLGGLALVRGRRAQGKQTRAASGLKQAPSGR